MKVIFYGTTHNYSTGQNMTKNCYLHFKKSVLSKINGGKILFLCEGMNLGLITTEDKHYDICVGSNTNFLIEFCRRKKVDLLFRDLREFAQMKDYSTYTHMANDYVKNLREVCENIEIRADVPKSMHNLEKTINENLFEWNFPDNISSSVIENKNLIKKWNHDTDNALLEEIKSHTSYDYIVVLFGCAHIINLKNKFMGTNAEFINVPDVEEFSDPDYVFATILVTYVTYYL